MNRYLLSIVSFALVISFVSCSKIKSEGDSLEPVKNGEAGKTYSLTLEQINIERNRDGAYVRLFDSTNKTIFVYVPKNLKNKILNLERSKKYIYKFKIMDKGKFSTLSGELIEVAGLDGKPVSGTLKDKTPSAGLLVLDGPDSYGKEFSIKLKYNGKKEENDKKIANFQSTGPYGKAVYCTYADDQAAKIDALEEGKEYTVKFKVDNTDWRVFSTLVSVE